jgi:hypothetical protein
MGKWTRPRLIATKSGWFDFLLDHDGPACYELGTGGPRGGAIQWHYVGETDNERRRMICYARSGSHLSQLIDWHLKQGWYLYYRGRACATKNLAKTMQDNLLSRFKYDWNQKLN